MVNLIKKYLPVRISFSSSTPDANGKQDEETFIFIKQHTSTHGKSKTLFVANAPFYQSIRPQILLKSIFERYGQVEKVTVIANPKKKTMIDEDGMAHVDDHEYKEGDLAVKMFERAMLSLQEDDEIGGSGGSVGGTCSVMDDQEFYDQGRFAHVHFTSSKEMKKAWVALGGSSNAKKKASSDGETITLKSFELSGLQDFTHKQYKEEKKKLQSIYNSDSEDDDDSNDEDDGANSDQVEQTKEDGKPSVSAIDSLIQLHRERTPSRSALKEACNTIMARYEKEEEEAKARQAAASQVDADGFVTVSYSTAVGDQLDMEQQGTLGSTGGAQGRMKKSGLKRARNRNKKLGGGDEQAGFYRFQLKESRKRKADDLKARFQEDLERVKKMKEEKMFRPF